MRTPTEALKEIRDRLTYFCLRTDGRYDPPWCTELVGIIDETATGSHAVGNAAAMRDAMVELTDKVLDYLQKGLIQLPLPLEDATAKARAALSAPARNCDLFGGDPKMLSTAWFDWTASPSGHDANGAAKMTFAVWLLAPAAERKGEGA